MKFCKSPLLAGNVANDKNRLAAAQCSLPVLFFTVANVGILDLIFEGIPNLGSNGCAQKRVLSLSGMATSELSTHHGVCNTNKHPPARDATSNSHFF